MSIEEKIKTAKEDSWLKDSVSEKEFNNIQESARRMTNEESKIFIKNLISDAENEIVKLSKSEIESLKVAIKALEQEPRKGEWLRMSDLSEQEDDRYQCSRCKNVVHYKDKMNLYTFNSWCGRCGSDNGRKNWEVEV